MDAYLSAHLHVILVGSRRTAVGGPLAPVEQDCRPEGQEGNQANPDGGTAVRQGTADGKSADWYSERIFRAPQTDVRPQCAGIPDGYDTHDHADDRTGTE